MENVPSPSHENQTVAHAVIDSLVENGVKYVFVGPATNHQFAFIDALYERKSDIQSILVRHEAMAPLMAEGWYRATHTPAAFHVGAGPALANTVLGVMAAYACGSAVIGISGDVHTEYWGRNGMQELQDKTFAQGHRILDPIVKRSWQVTLPNKVPEIMSQAFSAAVTGRPGPVLVDIPMDVFEMPCDQGNFTATNHLPAGGPAANSESVAAAYRLLSQATQPVILCGGGVILAEASQEALSVAERMGIPVVTSYTGKGSIPDDHPLAVGTVGAMGTEAAMTLMRGADVILALGTRFNEHSTSGWTPGLPYSIPSTKVIQVDVEPEELGRYYPVAVGIQADIRNFLLQLLDELPANVAGANSAEHPHLQALASARQRDREELEQRAAVETELVNPHQVVSKLRAALPRDAYLLPDAGLNGNYFNSSWEVYEAGTYIVDRGTAAMGYAPAAALGVKLAQPDKQVVVVTGDGCMTQVNWVLATAAEYGIAVKFIVLNDAALGGCRSVQQSVFNGRLMCTEFEVQETGEPYVQDFSELARFYKVDGQSISSNSQVDAALQDMLNARGPYLLDMRVDPDARPKGAGRLQISSQASFAP